MRPKRTISKVLAAAHVQAAGLESVDPLPEIGPEVTLPGYKGAMSDTQNKLDSYNNLLAEVDEAKHLLEESEVHLKTYSSKWRAAIGIKFGRDSNEYEMTGGRRTSDRRRPRLKALPVKPTT